VPPTSPVLEKVVVGAFTVPTSTPLLKILYWVGAFPAAGAVHERLIIPSLKFRWLLTPFK